MGYSWNSFYHALLRKKYIPNEDLSNTKLDRCLTTFDLTFLALCYAEFGSRVPKAGSAYVYSYVTVGEFMAFVIGWNLVLEYVIGTASVARGYSGYLDSLFNSTIARHLNETLPIHVANLSSYPDFLAFGITVLLTVLLAVGVKESTRFNNVCTILNLMIVSYAIICGSFKADVHNWHLTKEEVNKGSGGFFAYGFHGVMSAAGTCFYGYVGFDCIATTGEEAKNPQKSIPIAIVSSLFIVFLAYFSVSVVQTLMWPYYDQDVPAPLPYVFEMVGWPVAKWVISIGALTGLSTSLLGGMFPLPRILYAMANDGLIFKFLAKTHERLKVPMIATFIAGIFSGFMAMIFDIKALANMMSIGTLLAYTLVAVSVLILRYQIQEERIPLAPLSIGHGRFPSESSFIEGSGVIDSFADEPSITDKTFLIRKMASRNINVMTASTNTMLASTQHYTYKDVLLQVFNSEKIEVQTMLSSKISITLIILISLFLVVLDLLLNILEDDLFAIDPGAFFAVGVMFVIVLIFVIALARQPSDQQKLSFRVPCVPVVPVLSIFVNFYLMLKLPSDTWKRFLYWMIAGFVIYFGYGIWHSSERKLPAPPLSTVVEQPCKDSDNDEKETENSPLLHKKS